MCLKKIFKRLKKKEYFEEFDSIYIIAYEDFYDRAVRSSSAEVNEKQSTLLGADLHVTDSNKENRESEELNVDSVEFTGEFTLGKNEAVRVLEDTESSSLTAGELDYRYVIGNPGGTFYQKPKGLSRQSMATFRSDNVSDAYQFGEYLLLAGSSKGALHQIGTIPRQDSYSYGIYETDSANWIVIAISDGVSSADYSHVLADYLTFAAVKEMKSQLESFGEIKVPAFADKINILANDFCLKQLTRMNQEFDENRYTAQLGAKYFGATLECVVVLLESNFAQVNQFTVSGDGGTYFFNKNTETKVIKTGKTRNDEVVSNAVTPLPTDNVQPIVAEPAYLDVGDILFITTDGLSDFIGDGESELGNFLKEKLSEVDNPIEFLKIINVAMFQLDDDKTAVCLKYTGGTYG